MKGDSALASDTEGVMGRSQSDTAHIARLREQVDALMKDRVTPLVANAAGRVEAVAHNAVDAVREQAGTITSKVREHPLLAVLIAAGIGRPVDQSRPSAWSTLRRRRRMFIYAIAP